MDNEQEDIFFAAAKQDLKLFAELAFRILYPSKKFIDNFHIDAILYALTESFEGRMPRLTINLPPRHLKSFLCSIVWPAFVLGHDPSAQIMVISYSATLAKELAHNFRRLVNSPQYKRIFNKTVFMKSTEDESKTTMGGARYARSVDGTITGIGADIIIMDDPMQPEAALSDKARHTAIEAFKSTIVSRLDNKAKGLMILVQQRIHQSDMSGYLSNSGFHKLSFPAIAQTYEKVPVGKGLFYVRHEGDLLCPELEDYDTLMRTKKEIGSYNFAAQWLQRPEAPEGAFFKRKHLHYADKLPCMNRNVGKVWISIDAALSVEETADYTSIAVGFSEFHTGLHYIVFAERGRWDYEELLKRALKYTEKYESPAFVIENAAAGISLNQRLRRLGHNLMPHQAVGTKLTRAYKMLPVWEEDRIRIVNIPKHNTWVEAFESELLTFPYARYDDQVDSFVQGIRYGHWQVPKAFSDHYG